MPRHLTHLEIGAELRAIEALVPAMLEDRTSFPRVFEDLAEQLVARVAPADKAATWTALEAIVARSGFNRAH